MQNNSVNKNQGDIMKETTVKYFNNTAKDYDNSHDGKFVNCMYQEIIDRVRNLEGDKILDLGCGNGNIINLLKKERKADYYGLDISENMIEEAKKKCGEDVKFTVGDSENLPYQDGQFDIIICNASFHHYTKPEVAVKEIKRVLKSGGTLILGDPTVPELVRGFFNKMLPYTDSGDFKIYGKKDILPIFEAQGFEIENWKRLNYRTFIFNAKKK
ncbi:class I SAM-dependent methyltransferase [Intestinibacter bartlettii]